MRKMIRQIPLKVFIFSGKDDFEKCRNLCGTEFSSTGEAEKFEIIAASKHKYLQRINGANFFVSKEFSWYPPIQIWPPLEGKAIISTPDDFCTSTLTA